jgi:hypothetical protein
VGRAKRRGTFVRARALSESSLAPDGKVKPDSPSPGIAYVEFTTRLLDVAEALTTVPTTEPLERGEMYKVLGSCATQ